MCATRINPENPNANLKSYYKTYQSFSWDEFEKELEGYDPSRLNIVNYAIDRWARDEATMHKRALVFEKAGSITNFSYLQLSQESCRWANMLVGLGLKPGDRTIILLPRSPEIYVAMLACARAGIVFANVYPSYGFEELEWMLTNAEARAIITNGEIMERLSKDGLGSVERLCVLDEELPGIFKREVLIQDLLADCPDHFENRLLSCESPLYFLYTSGSTGPPKGVVHAHGDMLGHLMTGRYVLDISQDSSVWTNADPAWVTGTVYGAFAPWLCGATSISQGDPFSASTWYRTLERHKVSVWYTTPSILRKLKEAGDDLPGRYDFSNLRHIATVGDSLAPELYFWVRKVLKHVPHDTWWMTETGMICVANFPSEQTRPGSFGKPVPGVEAAVVDSKGNKLPILTIGELALKPKWPAMMKAIWNDETRYAEYFRNGWFLTGDMVIRDENGYYSHQGRKDDLIKVGQKMIGPYEIEATLRLHPAVAEAAAISKLGAGGKPEVKVFVTLNPGSSPSLRLNHHIGAFVKANLDSEMPLYEIQFMDELPKSLSGKLLRRVLRASELGLPSGDPTKLSE